MAARVLVADASKLGSTAQIADSIAATLRAAGLDAEATAARDVTDLTAFDAGAPDVRWAPRGRRPAGVDPHLLATHPIGDFRD